MSGRERKQECQKIREQKMLENLRTGRARYVPYEQRGKKGSLPNRVNVNVDIAEMQDTAEKTAAVYRQMLPSLLKKFSRIKDPRAPHKVKHKKTVLLLYGILMFAFHVGSRREANRTIDAVRFENLQAVFPELETFPHADTLARFLEQIDVSEIQTCMIELLKDLIRRKKFRNNLYNNQLLIAIDGTQKFYRNYQWDLENPGLKRHVGEEKTEQHYVYVLESVVILENGVTLPLLSEFLRGDDPELVTIEASGESSIKQDCERRAFRRLAARIKALFRNTHISITVDGLYACGPVIKLCSKYNWGFMITLKEGAMSAVWADAVGIMRIDEENRHQVNWGDRRQAYYWANDIEYDYEDEDGKRRLKLHVVVCHETWTEERKRTAEKAEQCETWYAWLSSKRLSAANVFSRCTKLGRFRWRIENNILTEKHQGYFYEHCYSYKWNAMEGYHYLMKIGRFLNVMAANSDLLNNLVQERGIRGFVRFVWDILGKMLLSKEGIRIAAEKMHQWRLVA